MKNLAWCCFKDACADANNSCWRGTWTQDELKKRRKRMEEEEDKRHTEQICYGAKPERLKQNKFEERKKRQCLLPSHSYNRIVAAGVSGCNHCDVGWKVFVRTCGRISGRWGNRPAMSDLVILIWFLCWFPALGLTAGWCVRFGRRKMSFRLWLERR